MTNRKQGKPKAKGNGITSWRRRGTGQEGKMPSSRWPAGAEQLQIEPPGCAESNPAARACQKPPLELESGRKGCGRVRSTRVHGVLGAVVSAPGWDR